LAVPVKIHVPAGASGTNAGMTLFYSYPKLGSVQAAVLILAVVASSITTALTFQRLNTYQYLCRSSITAVYHGQYRRARILATKALHSTGKGRRDANCGLELASALVAMGNYREAKSVMERLPDVTDSLTERDYPECAISYRRYLLGEALSGLHDYRGAIAVLRPGLKISGCTADIQFELLKAHLALNEPEVAAAYLGEMPKGYTSKFFNIYSGLTKLSAGNEGTAKRISRDLVTFFLDNEKLHDPEGVYNLEYASEFMNRKGYADEALELKAQADKLKQQ